MKRYHTLTIPDLIKNVNPVAKSPSEIAPDDHQQALFFIQSVMGSEELVVEDFAFTIMTLLSIKYCRDSINEESSISSPHQN